MSVSHLLRRDQAPLTVEVRPDRRDRHAVTVLVGGEVDLSTVEALRSVLEVLDPGHHHVVLDLAGVRFIDSLGVGLLVEVRRRFAAERRSLELRHPSDPVRKVLELTGLAQVFAVTD